MSSFKPLQSTTAVFMSLSILVGAAVPLVASSPAAAQRFPQESRNRRVVIPAGTSIPLRYDKAEKIVLSPDETVPLTLRVPRNIKSRNGTILIPAGSEVVGQLEPANRVKGSRFVANELILYNGRGQSINASSKIITRTEEIRRGANTSSILKGAAIGGAAATALATILGDKAIATEEILGGAGLGALGGLLLGRRTVEVVVVEPDTDLDITLRSELALR